MESHSTGIHCQLLNPVAEDHARVLIANPAWCAQEKFDGRRLLIQKTGNCISGINRLGLAVAVPEPIAAAAEAIPADFIMDGEAVGEHLYVFDLLAFNGTDMRPQPYGDRYCQLSELIDPNALRAIRLVATAFLPEQKREFAQRLRAEGREGVVFKRLDARYTAGRPTAGGAQLKLKFTESASFIVSKVNGKRSVALTLLDGEQVVPVGNVTIPPNHDIPPVGAIIDARYLYAHLGGSIFQPVYLGVRDDTRAEECVISQLKYKSQPATES
jgi:bifunctional non-homologous end joining protein LigD